MPGSTQAQPVVQQPATQPTVDPNATIPQQNQTIIQQASQHPISQAVGGSLMNAANTPVGGSAMLVGSNLAMAQVGQQALGSAEIPALAALVTFLFQFVKQHPKFDQDRWWHITLIVISLLVAYFVWRDVIKAIEGTGFIVLNAVANYQSWKQTGWGGLTP